MAAVNWVAMTTNKLKHCTVMCSIEDATRHFQYDFSAKLHRVVKGNINRVACSDMSDITFHYLSLCSGSIVRMNTSMVSPTCLPL